MPISKANHQKDLFFILIDLPLNFSMFIIIFMFNNEHERM
ncbi:hypothetical protein COO91_07634 [Nostoc flagelliforme CCNUN1]|uniref:Uncharacterized protein n=1 Tax=Nostoc flagelliforme CCNUN1 TaxID=2038116 RepID=A0A2K8T1L4_9NOSO|nr:hypothetical protein COO91_07634 [Nostoc flagelliforme CCNUN1]